MMHYNKGFTLIELMVVVAIMGVLAMAVAPSMRVMLQRNHVAKQMRDLSSIVQEARGKAVLERHARYPFKLEAGVSGGFSKVASNEATWAPDSNRVVAVSADLKAWSFNLLGALDGVTKDQCIAIAHVDNSEIAQILVIERNGNAKVHKDRVACP